MPHKPLEGDFLLVPPLLFIGLPSLQGDGLFCGPFSSWQVASSCWVVVDKPDVGRSCSRRRRTAAFCTQWCKYIPPCPTRGAAFFVPTRVIRMAASVAWPRRGEEGMVADRSVGILLREGKREIGRVVRHANKRKSHNSYVEFILIYVHNLQYRSEISPPNIEWRESQGDMVCTFGRVQTHEGVDYMPQE